jgi:hypothetical protein
LRYYDADCGRATAQRQHHLVHIPNLARFGCGFALYELAANCGDNSKTNLGAIGSQRHFWIHFWLRRGELPPDLRDGNAMNVPFSSTHRWRTILDGCLIILLILFLAAQGQGARAESANPMPVVNALLPGEGEAPAPGEVQISNTTAAAIIAAENAALGLPQYTFSLPTIFR